MKKLFLSIILLAVFGFYSCDPAEQYPISFKIDGTTWYAASAPAILTGSNNISINSFSTIQNQSPIAFYFTQYAVGAYQLDHVNNYFQYGDTTTGYYAQSNNPATLVITEFNSSTKKISGEFYGNLYNAAQSDSVLVTDGKFHLYYQ